VNPLFSSEGHRSLRGDDEAVVDRGGGVLKINVEEEELEGHRTLYIRVHVPLGSTRERCYRRRRHHSNRYRKRSRDGRAAQMEGREWLKFEEDVEDGGERWSKPYVATLSLHSLFELRSCIGNGAVLLEMSADGLEEVADMVLDHQELYCPLGDELRGRVRDGPAEAPPPPEPDEAGQPPHHHRHIDLQFMKKIPVGAEVCNVLVGELEVLANAVVAFFLFILLGPLGRGPQYHEIGRSIATLMTDEVFHDVAYKAKDRIDLIAGIDEFLDQVTVLPPGEWDPSIRIEPPKNVPSQASLQYYSTFSGQSTEGRKKICVLGEEDEPGGHGGPELDRTGRAPHYLSDFTDACSLQCLASLLFLYCACMSPVIITFGGLLGEVTEGRIPLTILGSTGPVLVFEKILFKENGLSYLSLRNCIGLWTAFLCLVLVATDASSLVCYITRFTEEAFASLICVIFIYEALEKLVHLGRHYPYNKNNDLDKLSLYSAPHYLSDFTDACSLQCLASLLFLYCACMSPVIITFGGLLGEVTEGRIPLTILGSTGPVLVFEKILFKENGLSYLSLRNCIGLWTAFLCLVLVATDASSLVCYITRFTEEAFASLICVIFIYEALEKLIHLGRHYPFNRNNDLDKLSLYSYVAIPPATHTRTLLQETQDSPVHDGPRICLAWRDIFIIIRQVHLKKTVVGSGGKSRDCVEKTGGLWGKCGAYPQGPTVLKMLFWCVLLFFSTVFMSAFLKDLKFSSYFPTKPARDDRGWYISPLGPNPWWTAVVSVVPALLCTILIFMDQQITAVIINRKEHRLKKGCGYRLDLLVVGVMLVFMTSVLKFIPMPVLYGVFLYMGASSFFDRLKLFFMPAKHQPDCIYLRHVPLRKVHLFTAIQLSCLALLWTIKTCRAAIVFPMMVLAPQVFIRKLLDCVFTKRELSWLDELMPENKKKILEEVEFTNGWLEEQGEGRRGRRRERGGGGEEREEEEEEEEERGGERRREEGEEEEEGGGREEEERGGRRGREERGGRRSEEGEGGEEEEEEEEGRHVQRMSSRWLMWIIVLSVPIRQQQQPHLDLINDPN
ncbi:hypothetical protein CRUP_008408, partial [Coryphaenoides rupestris]